MANVEIATLFLLLPKPQTWEEVCDNSWGLFLIFSVQGPSWLCSALKWHPWVTRKKEVCTREIQR